MAMELQGEIEKLTYTNEENSFTIVQLKLKDNQQTATIVGNFPPPGSGRAYHRNR